MKVLAISLLWASVTPHRVQQSMERATSCPPKGFESTKDFDLNAFAKKRWYVQQMMVTSHRPRSRNFCVYADYFRLSEKSSFGYDLLVDNHAEDKNGKIYDSNDRGGGIFAKIVDEKTGKLKVAPAFLQNLLAGPYWVLAHEEAEGWSVVSGGPPTEPGDGGKCRTGTGTNKSGLWIFTRTQKRDYAIIAKARALAEAKGFDLSVLNDVDQSNCKESSA